LHNTILAFAILIALPFLSCIPATGQEQFMLEATSDQSTFKVEINWTPNSIGSANIFDIHFIEPETRQEIEDVRYDFSIYMGDHREILRRNQTATHQEFNFYKSGSYEIRIDDIEGLGESALIPVHVTPEFPILNLVLIAIPLVVATIVSRHNSNTLFNQPTY